MSTEKSLRSQILGEKKPISLGIWPDVILILILVILSWQINSLLLLAGAFYLFYTKLDQFKKQNIIASVLIIILSLFVGFIIYSNFLPLQEPFETVEKTGLLVSLALILIFKTIISVRFENNTFADSFRQNIFWFILLVSALVIFFTNLNYLDFTAAFAICVYLIFQLTTILIKGAPIKAESSRREKPAADEDKISMLEVPQKAIEEMLEVDKLEKLYDLKIIQDSQETLVVGHLIVANTCTQEEIFEIKGKVKDILKKHDLNDSTLEVKYLIEFEKNM